MNQALTERYRPVHLEELAGQLAVVRQLRAFAAKPVAKAFLFAGPTGVGKTSAAYALARALEESPERPTDVIEVGSGRATAERIDEVIGCIPIYPMLSRWRVILIDEADLMSSQAQQRWLSAVENLYDHNIVIFTTNYPGKLPARFVDRCERIDFRSDATGLAPKADALIKRIWKAETGRDDAPTVRDLPGVVDAAGALSFRRAIMRVETLIRNPKDHLPDRADTPEEIQAAIEARRAEMEARKPEGHSVAERNGVLYFIDHTANLRRGRKIKIADDPAFPLGASEQEREWFRWLEHAAGQARHPDDRAIIREAATRLVRLTNEAKKRRS